MKRWIIRSFFIGLLLATSSCERASPPPPSPIDLLVRDFKPGKPIGVGPHTFTAGKIVRVDQNTLEYDDVRGTKIDSEGKVWSLQARSLIFRFIPPDELDATWHHLVVTSPQGPTTTGEESHVGPYKIPVLKKKSGLIITPIFGLLVGLGSAGFAALLWLVWRKTRPKINPTKTFPVEVKTP